MPDQHGRHSHACALACTPAPLGSPGQQQVMPVVQVSLFMGQHGSQLRRAEPGQVLRVPPAELAATLGFAASFASITALFIVMADLVPKRLSMNEPERVAMALVGPMLLLCRLLKPLAWFFSSITEGLIRLLGLPAKRDETISHRDILALTEAGRPLADRAARMLAEDITRTGSSFLRRDFRSGRRLALEKLADCQAPHRVSLWSRRARRPDPARTA